ncbi:MAG: DUF4118 domain-containing protein, partial [Actinobacteria bacterium]|nr:DUF4118 domain-containing protein [Actinomycetota bacterium]
MKRSLTNRLFTNGRAVASAVGWPAVVTLLAVPDQNPPTAVVAVLYVLAVVVAARLGGGPAGLLASVVSFLALNFFFTEPLHSFKVGDLEDLVALVVFLAASAVVGLLLSSAQSARSNAERRETEARLVNDLATQLLGGETSEIAVSRFARGVCDFFGLERCEIRTPYASAITDQQRLDEDRTETVPLMGRR